MKKCFSGMIFIWDYFWSGNQEICVAEDLSRNKAEGISVFKTILLKKWEYIIHERYVPFY